MSAAWFRGLHLHCANEEMQSQLKQQRQNCEAAGADSSSAIAEHSASLWSEYTYLTSILPLRGTSKSV